MEEKIPGLKEGLTFEQHLENEPADLAALIRTRMEETELSPDFRGALEQLEKRTLLVYSYLDCPDCRAVLPVVAKIPEANPAIRLVMAGWSEEAERYLERKLGTGRVPTVLVMDAEGRLMDGAFIERPLETHRAAAEAATRKETMTAIGVFRNGEKKDQVEQDLLKVLNGEKIDILPFLK